MFSVTEMFAYRIGFCTTFTSGRPFEERRIAGNVCQPKWPTTPIAWPLPPGKISGWSFGPRNRGKLVDERARSSSAQLLVGGTSGFVQIGSPEVQKIKR